MERSLSKCRNTTCLGSLPVLGFYYVQIGSYTPLVVVGFILSGVLVHNLLLLNGFSDVEVDRKEGRKTLPIVLGERKACIVCSVTTMAVYLWILGGVAPGQTSR